MVGAGGGAGKEGGGCVGKDYKLVAQTYLHAGQLAAQQPSYLGYKGMGGGGGDEKVKVIN